MGGGPVWPWRLATEVRVRAMNVPPQHRPRMASDRRSPTRHPPLLIARARCYLLLLLLLLVESGG